MRSEVNIGRKDREMGCLPLMQSGVHFIRRAYNREKGELWGRTAVSWGEDTYCISLVHGAEQQIIWCNKYCLAGSL